MNFVSGERIAELFDYQEFLPQLSSAFCDEYVVPQRHHYHYENGQGPNPSTLLIMPAWSQGNYVGVKTVTVSPYNGDFDLPSIQGTYSLINATNGLIEAQLDAKSLTVKRTAAASALASSFLSRKDSESLLMVGTGALSAELIKAHCAVRPIKKVWIWGRSLKKVKTVIDRLNLPNVECNTIATIEAGIKVADIVSVATLSPDPLVFGKWLRPGQHLDLVGAYRPDMRESDDEVVKKASLFVDSIPAALEEAGDLAIPLKEGIIKKEDIKADLFALCHGKQKGRNSSEEITLFKSVGHALEDLAAALYLIKKL